jgi:hypothetical protein
MKTAQHTVSLKRLANAKTGLSEIGTLGLWYIRTGQINPMRESLDSFPLYHKLTKRDRAAIETAWQRVYTAAADAAKAANNAPNVRLMRQLLTIMRRRKIAGRLLGKEWKIKQIFDQITGGSRAGRADIAATTDSVDSYNRIAALRNLGERIQRLEQLAINRRAVSQAFAYARSLPLYACSGELEANTLDMARARKLARVTPFWNIGRDGGGQHEIRFRISGTLPALASGLVTGLGSTARNGGHIHLNCHGDEMTGRRVFNKMREQLAWMRYLCPLHRRRGRWSSVDAVQQTFDSARRVKGAALSTYSWSTTGTVEMRIWGTTASPEEWSFRARLMQSVARMSETRPVTDIDPNALITSDARRAAWGDFFTWAADNDPQTLRETLHALRKKGRTTRDTKGAQRARECVEQFDASGVRLSGYRRRTSNTITPAI